MVRKEKKRFLSSIGQRVMLIGVAICVAVCAVLFSILGVYMSNSSKKAVDQIGEKAMYEASYQLTQRFETVMNQRLKMVHALANEGGAANTEAERESLKSSAMARDFTYLAFWSVNEKYIDIPDRGRTVDFIYGDFTVTDFVPFRRSILNGEEKIAVGTGFTAGVNGTREDIVVCAVPATDHDMPDGKKSMALVVGFSNDDFVSMLNINSEGSGDTTAYIVRKNNSFVLRPKDDAVHENLSDLLKAEYGNKDYVMDTVILEMNESMTNNSVYSKIMQIEYKHIFMYCNKLDKSEWYLVSFTNNDEMNDVVLAMNSNWAIMIVVSVVTIIALLAALFFLYNYFNKKTN